MSSPQNVDISAGLVPKNDAPDISSGLVPKNASPTRSQSRVLDTFRKPKPQDMSRKAVARRKQNAAAAKRYRARLRGQQLFELPETDVPQRPPDTAASQDSSLPDCSLRCGRKRTTDRPEKVCDACYSLGFGEAYEPDPEW